MAQPLARRPWPCPLAPARRDPPAPGLQLLSAWSSRARPGLAAGASDSAPPELARAAGGTTANEHAGSILRAPRTEPRRGGAVAAASRRVHHLQAETATEEWQWRQGR